MMYVITALTIGLVGSLHCIGMCGPIAVALPLGNKGWGYRVFGGVTYNVGSGKTVKGILLRKKYF